MTGRPIRVLHLINWLNPGGIERWLLQMLKEVDLERYRMDIACKGNGVGSLAPEAVSMGARVWHTPFDWTHIGYASQLYSLIQKEQYNIIHNHLAVYAGLAGVIAKMSRVSTVLSFHNTDHASDSISNQGLRRLRDVYGHMSILVADRCADVVTGCSTAVIDANQAKYRISKHKARVLYYGVEVPQILNAEQRAAVRKEIDVSSEAPMIVHIGRFVPQKNHRMLLAIASRLLAQFPSAIFVLIGDGPLRLEIAAEIQANNLSSNFRVLGVRHDIERILGASDVLLFPSLWEGLGLVAIEANAAGIPVVASDVPGLREAVRHGETGFLVPHDSIEAFVNALRVLLSNDLLRSRMGEAGRRRVQTQFSPSASARKLCELYDELLCQEDVPEPFCSR